MAFEDNTREVEAIMALIEETGQATKANQLKLVNHCLGDDNRIDNLLEWLVTTCGVKLQGIVCEIKCQRDQRGQLLPGKPRPTALRLSRPMAGVR